MGDSRVEIRNHFKKRSDTEKLMSKAILQTVIIMKTTTLILLFLFVSFTSYAITWQVTNSGFTFSPSTVTIQIGDNVDFILDPNHNAVEVSAATWAANGSDLNGGFMVNFGGGIVTGLSIGTHYYVCEPHASFGMKGKIIVVGSTAVNEIKEPVSFTLTPNPASNFIRVTVNDANLLGSTYLLFDQVGQQLIAGQLSNKVTSIAVSELPSGLYFVRVGGLKTNTFKVLIRK